MENNIKNLIEENDIEKLTSKMSKLETQVKKFNKENAMLKAKVNNMETILEKVCSQLKIPIKISGTSDQKTSSTNDNLEEETWLYYVKKGVNKEKILNAIGVKSGEGLIMEMKVDEWIDEKKMLVEILRSIQKFQEFSEDWSQMSAKQLNHYLQTILSSTMVSDTVVILRNLPGKSSKNYDKIISNIASLAGIMYNSWEELEINNELIGKMALVLESEEELQILNVLKKNNRLILFVDALFK